MKKLFLTLGFLGMMHFGFAQEITLEKKNLFGLLPWQNIGGNRFFKMEKLCRNRKRRYCKIFLQNH